MRVRVVYRILANCKTDGPHALIPSLSSVACFPGATRLLRVYEAIKKEQGPKMDLETQTPATAENLQLASEIVSAYVSRNQIARDELTDLIRSVHGTLSGLASGTASSDGAEQAPSAPLVPAVPIDQSVTEDAIICLEDGKAFKTLKRHLRTAYDMSPEEYREKWGLSKTYPMVAPSYSARRAETAKRIGLGRKPAAEAKPAPKRKRAAKKTA